LKRNEQYNGGGSVRGRESAVSGTAGKNIAGKVRER